MEGPQYQAEWLVSDKSTKDKSGDQEGLQVAFMHSELTCIWEHVEKITVLPQELTLLRNSIGSAQGDLGVVGTHSLAKKSDVASMAANVKNTRTEINSLNTHVIGLRSDTMALKSDLHGLSKNVVESKLDKVGVILNALIDHTLIFYRCALQSIHDK